MRPQLVLLAASVAHSWAVPPRGSRRPALRSRPLALSSEAAGSRPPYALSGLERPTHRGAVMGFLHNTGAWYALSAAYVAAALKQLDPLTLYPAFLRVALVAASSYSIYISDCYHNADKRREGVTEAGELKVLRRDYLGISLILSTNTWLWAHNLGGSALMHKLCLAATACTANVALQSFYVVILGTLGLTALKAKSPAALIYAAYAPGFLIYATKFPKRRTWGYHELFHLSVLAGNLVSIGFDLGGLGLFSCAVPCSSLASRLTLGLIK
jgi:predicted membrane channel-forming protein YqfA (hemolysin III family)